MKYLPARTVTVVSTGAGSPSRTRPDRPLEENAEGIQGVPICMAEVTKTYHQGAVDVPALSGVSLDVPAGQFLSVMGPSGCGKSTLLHLLGGLDTPTSGEILIGATPISAMSDDEITVFRRRRIGFVFQFFNLLPNLTAVENVALPALLDGGKPKEALSRAEAMLERVGLAHRRQHKPTELSGGEMQRVAIARALVIEPTILLADELTGNLDSRTGEEILALLGAIREASGPTIVMVTHDPRAACYAERIVVLKDGRIASDGPTAEL